jgi:hypothetical protein
MMQRITPAAVHFSVEGALPSLDGGKRTAQFRLPMTAAGLALQGRARRYLELYVHQLVAHPALCAGRAEKYQDKGLLILVVHSPEFMFEQDIDNVRRAALSMGITYPIATDNGYAIWLGLNKPLLASPLSWTRTGVFGSITSARADTSGRKASSGTCCRTPALPTRLATWRRSRASLTPI